MAHTTEQRRFTYLEEATSGDMKMVKDLNLDHSFML